MSLYHLFSIHVLISSRCYLHGKCASAVQPLVTSHVHHGGIFFPRGWKPAYSCSLCGTSSHHCSGTGSSLRTLLQALRVPGWLLGPLDHSWGHLSRLSTHDFPSTSHCLPITAQLDERCSKLRHFRGWCTNCKWLGCTEGQPHPSLLNTWALRGLETRHPATGTTTSRVNSLPPHTPLTSGGREGLAKRVATLMAPGIGRDDAVGFHSRMLHRAGACEQRQGEMCRNYAPHFTLHSLLLSVGTPSCAA